MSHNALIAIIMICIASIPLSLAFSGCSEQPQKDPCSHFNQSTMSTHYKKASKTLAPAKDGENTVLLICGDE